MTIALGHYALWLAGALALIQAVIPALLADECRACAIAVSAAKTQAALFTLSIIALACGFLANDFSVRYIAAHSNSLLPWYYRATAVWGGHEGSLLLWITILAWWAAAFAAKSRDLPDAVRGKTLAILGYISVGFTGFIGFTSNPFTRILPAPFDGADLNPLLQDPGLILHPPLLYTGYVGFAVAYAIILANLWQGRLDTLSLRRARPWTLAAWCALTLGIALGSYWAYYELGWGGWWFWDSVENASLMPWLIGAALIHSLIVSEKRGGLRTWTALLAISAFTLSFIGTFLVRSGVLTSVHAFAADPTRGVYILALIVANTLPALILLILRAPQLASDARHGLLARETGILANNWLLAGACLIVFTGTLYPLLADTLNLGKISVGAPYYNRLIVPLALASLILLAVGPLLRWQRDRARRLLPRLAIMTTAAALATLAICHAADAWQWRTITAVACATFAASAIPLDYLDRLRHRIPAGRPYHGMQLAHLGYIVLALAITAANQYSIEEDHSIKEGASVNIADYRLTLMTLTAEKGPNYSATVGKILVQKNDGTPLTVLTPSKRQYHMSAMPMTESARRVTVTHDLYVALGEAINADTWAIRIQYKPYISWIWLGGLLMALGAVLAMSGRRAQADSA